MECDTESLLAGITNATTGGKEYFPESQELSQVSDIHVGNIHVFSKGFGDNVSAFVNLRRRCSSNYVPERRRNRLNPTALGCRSKG